MEVQYHLRLYFVGTFIFYRFLKWPLIIHITRHEISILWACQDHYRKKGQKGQKGLGNSNCPPKIPGQKMYFAGPDACSIASANMMYLAHDGHIKRAVKGEIIEMKLRNRCFQRFFIC